MATTNTVKPALASSMRWLKIMDGYSWVKVVMIISNSPSIGHARVA